MSDLPASATRVLDEVRSAGLDLSRIPGSSAKIRLILDLRAQLGEVGKLRVLDVGCGGLSQPFNVWEPLVPFADRLDVVGVDVDHLEPTRRRAAELGFPITLRQASVFELTEAFRPGSFDAVVCTQVLEHLPDWVGALRQMHDVLRSDGHLFLTCDSGDLGRGPANRGRLVVKRAYARVATRVPAVGRALRPFASGEWERGQRLGEVGDAASSVGFEVELLAHYALRDVKDARGGSGARLLALAFEEALREEAETTPFATRYRIIYLRARRS
ncbi:MAG TPA: methyltransferase domain-containing protein [Gaiellaceae bacterium]|nr:methyltransferase domain-containing protein [Gaiellaceae bacterium]